MKDATHRLKINIDYRLTFCWPPQLQERRLGQVAYIIFCQQRRTVVQLRRPSRNINILSEYCKKRAVYFWHQTSYFFQKSELDAWLALRWTWILKENIWIRHTEVERTIFVNL